MSLVLATSTVPAPTDRTVLGPLTTTFSYPATCTGHVQPCFSCIDGILTFLENRPYPQGKGYVLDDNAWQGAWQGQACTANATDFYFRDNPNCWPPRATDAAPVTTPSPLNGWGVYSPGLACPSGYVTACSAVGGLSGFPFQFAPAVAETAVGCCPSGYTCSYDGQATGQTCTRVASVGSYPVVVCGTDGSTSRTFFQAVPASVTTFAAISTSLVPVVYGFSSATLYAPLFQLLHHASDLPPSATLAPSAGSSLPYAPSSNLSFAPTLFPTQSSTTALGAKTRGMSAGAKASIAVGTIAFVAALIGAIYLFWLMRHRKLAHLAAETTGTPPEKRPELAGDRTTQIFEIAMPPLPFGSGPPPLSPGQTERYELG